VSSSSPASSSCARRRSSASPTRARNPCTPHAPLRVKPVDREWPRPSAARPFIRSRMWKRTWSSSTSTIRRSSRRAQPSEAAHPAGAARRGSAGADGAHQRHVSPALPAAGGVPVGLAVAHQEDLGPRSRGHGDRIAARRGADAIRLALSTAASVRDAFGAARARSRHHAYLDLRL